MNRHNFLNHISAMSSQKFDNRMLTDKNLGCEVMDFVVDEVLRLINLNEVSMVPVTGKIKISTTKKAYLNMGWKQDLIIKIDILRWKIECNLDLITMEY